MKAALTVISRHFLEADTRLPPIYSFIASIPWPRKASPHCLIQSPVILRFFEGHPAVNDKLALQGHTLRQPLPLVAYLTSSGCAEREHGTMDTRVWLVCFLLSLSLTLSLGALVHNDEPCGVRGAL